ncbi:hypothetical protein EST38_g10768 [Candolleomyces aberdarensis]|uniref:Uncharacterized protein n=1 Tax=Candolleomyces aberdarensis TaxID=2316362 RepID=A0A4Q2D8Z3_9AGAR|nr:hypothetical protein EST38_g10768 [Candolleomyces aberdarensis]
MLTSTHPVHAISHGIKGGLYHFLLHLFLPHGGPESSQHASLLKTYQYITLHVIYTSVRGAAIQALRATTLGNIANLTREFPEYKPVFRMLKFAKRTPIEHEERTEYMKQLCDNPMEAEERRPTRPSISKRTQLLAFVEHMCHLHYFQTLENSGFDPSRVPVLSIDAVGGADISVDALRRSDFWNDRVYGNHGLHLDKEARLKTFFDEARRDPTIKLAEGFFLYGECIIAVVVKMRYLPSLSEHRFYVLSAVHSYGGR